jgi:hypothetical protein
VKKFALKLIIFSIPFILFLSIPKIWPFSFDRELDIKIRTFLPEPDSVEVIIAGDSRAERSLIPEVFIKRLGLNTVNIAKGVGNLISLYKTFQKYGLLIDSHIVIISASIWQINDGAVSYGYISQNELIEMPFWGQIKLLKLQYPRYLLERMRLIWNEMIGKYSTREFDVDDSRIGSHGFLAIESVLNQEKLSEISLNPNSTKHPFYTDFNMNGHRNKVFQKALKLFNESGSTIVIYKSPVSPAWRTYTENSFISHHQNEFSEFLKQSVSQYDNIHYLDLYNNQSTHLLNDHFYDIQHLNLDGASIFTNALIDSLIDRNIIQRN